MNNGNDKRFMEYKEIKPCGELAAFIHCFWELKGANANSKRERNFPDGCSGLVVNLGSTCITDNGAVKMDFGKTFAVGATTSFKDSLIEAETHLLGVCLKPAAFSRFYKYAPQNELTNRTIELEKKHSFDITKLVKNPIDYLNSFFIDRLMTKNDVMRSVIEDIHQYKGLLSINDVAKRNATTVRQLERNFKIHIGLTPKEYSNIIRFQNALSLIKTKKLKRSLLDIAFDCGYYDHSHLTNEIKKNTGILPSQF